MKRLFVLVLVLVLDFRPAAAAANYGPTIFYDDVSLGTWTAITGVVLRTSTGGVYTNDLTYTNAYRVSATNAKGRLPLGATNLVIFGGNTNLTNSVVVSWPIWGGVSGYVIEQSFDQGATWTNWYSIGASNTNWTDYGTNGGCTYAAFTSSFPSVAAAPVVPWTNASAGVSQAQMDAATGRIANVEGYTNRAGTALQPADTNGLSGTNALNALLRVDGTTPLTGDWHAVSNAGRRLSVIREGGPASAQAMVEFETGSHSGQFGLGAGAALQMELYSGGNVYAQWGEQNDDSLAKTNDLDALESDIYGALNPKIANHKARLDMHGRTLAESLWAIKSALTWGYYPFSQYKDEYLTSEASTDQAASTNLAYSAGGDYYEPRWIVSEGNNEVAWYKCEDNTSSQDVTDSSGNGQTGATVANNTDVASTENGKISRGFGISNSSDNAWSVTLTSITGYYYTVSAWASADTWDSGVDEFNVYFQKVNESEYSIAEMVISYWQGVQCQFSDDGHNESVFVATNVNGVWSAGEWHLLTLVVQSNACTFYVDAVLVGSAALPTLAPSPAPWGQPSAFGYSPSYGRAWNGTIDDVRFYSGALNAGQVAEIYNSGSGTADPLGSVATTNEVAVYQTLPWTAAGSNNHSLVEILADTAVIPSVTNFMAQKAVDGVWSNLSFASVGAFQGNTNWTRWRAETGHAAGMTNILRAVWSNSCPVKIKGWVDWVEEVVE